MALLVPVSGQDTLRTYGPEIGVDISGLAHLFASPPRFGAGANLSLGITPDLYPAIELGYSGMSDSVDGSAYSSAGMYGRIGLDYNILPLSDPSVHHRVYFGFRYALSVFRHQAENIRIPGEYWGDYVIEQYENSLQAHWLELVGGVRAEVLPNFFMGWSVRYAILLNPDMDPQITPLMIPGFGKGTENRALLFTYTLAYKIPILKK